MPFRYSRITPLLFHEVNLRRHSPEEQLQLGRVADLQLVPQHLHNSLFTTNVPLTIRPKPWVCVLGDIIAVGRDAIHTFCTPVPNLKGNSTARSLMLSFVCSTAPPTPSCTISLMITAQDEGTRHAIAKA
ncbi:hypothetical protein AURDEDRAFT_156664 [Auricularia subglabra TFB-10046 SS5]|nr:hypothetical protein AURDEDRAFT_156664 [Auricularia subglabra TFB-10046 SS5]